MSSPKNPYSIGGSVPPDQFVGREREIAQAFDYIHKQAHVAVWGEPKIGKSSFLEYLASAEVWQKQGLDPSTAIVVLVNCQTIQPFTAADFWREVLTNLEQKFEGDPNLKAEIISLLGQEQVTQDSFRQILRKLGRQDKFLVLLVDDYDAALDLTSQHPDDVQAFVNACRSFALRYDERRYFSMIVATVQRLEKLGPPINPNNPASPWYNHYAYIPLRPFTDREINELLKHLTSGVRQGIQHLTGRNPALLQLAAYLNHQARELGTGQIADGEELAREIEIRTRQIFQSAWNRSNPDQQTLLVLIAIAKLRGRFPGKQFDLSGISDAFSQQERELRTLKERGLIVSTGQLGLDQYAFDSIIMEQYVIQELMSSNDEKFLDRQKVLLGINRQQAERITDAARWFWNNKSQMPTVLKSILDVIKLIP